MRGTKAANAFSVCKGKLTVEQIEKNIFRAAVTSTAFSLSLSMNQIACLRDVQDGGLLCFSHFIKGYRSLHDRGLIRAEGRGRGWKLTEAGELVVKLLDYAGLCE